MYRIRRFSGLLLFVLPLAALLLAGCVGLSPIMSHQGRLVDGSGNPVADGDYEIVYKIFDAATAGNEKYTETQTVAVKDGYFTTSVGMTGPIDPTVFATSAWLEVTINGETLTPRQLLQGSPYAFSLATGAVVQGLQTIERDFAGQTKTGAALTVINADSSATGGHGLLAINRAAAAGGARDEVAALQARAVGGVAGDATGAYGAIITSTAYRGLYAKGASIYYSAYVDGDLFVGGNCVGCLVAYYGQNAGSAAIRPGDLVAVDGVVADPDLGTPVMQVRRATSAADAVIGVATGAASRAPVGEFNGVTTGGFSKRAGAAQRGDYVVIAVQGLVQARASDAALRPGTSVGPSTDGVVAAAGGPFRALSAVDANGLVWVMVGATPVGGAPGGQ